MREAVSFGCLGATARRLRGVALCLALGAPVALGGCGSDPLSADGSAAVDGQVVPSDGGNGGDGGGAPSDAAGEARLDAPGASDAALDAGAGVDAAAASDAPAGTDAPAASDAPAGTDAPATTDTATSDAPATTDGATDVSVDLGPTDGSASDGSTGDGGPPADVPREMPPTTCSDAGACGDRWAGIEHVVYKPEPVLEPYAVTSISGPGDMGGETGPPAYSPDSCQIAVPSLDGFVKIYRSATGELLHTVPVPENIKKVAWSPDGTRLAVGGQSTVGIIWPCDGKLTWVWHPSSGVDGVAWFPDSRWLAVARAASGGETVVMVDTDAGTSDRTFPTGPGPLGALMVAPDGKTFYTCLLDNCTSWDATTGKVVTPIKPVALTFTATLSWDGTRIVSGLYVKVGSQYVPRVGMWDAPAGAGVKVFSAGATDVLAIGITPDNAKVVGRDFAGTSIYVWRASDGVLLDTYPISDVVDEAALSPDGTTVALTSRRTSLRVLRLGDGAPAFVHAGPYALGAVARSPDGTRLATSSIDSYATVWNTADATVVRSLGAPVAVTDQAVRGMAFSPDGTRLAGVTNAGRLQAWKLSDGAQVLDMQLGASSEALAWSHDGATLAVGVGFDIKAVDVAGKTVTGTFVGESGQDSKGHEFSPDDSVLASCYGDVARLWHVSDRSPLGSIGNGGGMGGCVSVHFTPDASKIAVAYHPQVQLYSYPAGVSLGAVIPHSVNGLDDMLVSDDGKTLVLAEMGEGISLWDLVGNKRLTWTSISRDAFLIAAAPDLKWIASTSFASLWWWRPE